MKAFTQDELDLLIACPKTIVEPPRRELREERGSLRNDLRLRSADGALEFSVFLRVNADFPENFSIGLVHSPPDERGSITLVRCNGPHGPYNADLADPEAHFEYHVHQASAARLEAGLKAEGDGRATREYASYREALVHFLRLVNLQEAARYFPDLQQPLLNLGEEE